MEINLDKFLQENPKPWTDRFDGIKCANGEFVSYYGILCYIAALEKDKKNYREALKQAAELQHICLIDTHEVLTPEQLEEVKQKIAEYVGHSVDAAQDRKDLELGRAVRVVLRSLI